MRPAPQRPAALPRPARQPARQPTRMIGPFFPDFSTSKLMQSEIVRKEMGALERDYAELAKLGSRYEVSLFLLQHGARFLPSAGAGTPNVY